MCVICVDLLITFLCQRFYQASSGPGDGALPSSLSSTVHLRACLYSSPRSEPQLTSPSLSVREVTGLDCLPNQLSNFITQ